jgi:hypothetical protein
MDGQIYTVRAHIFASLHRIVSSSLTPTIDHTLYYQGKVCSLKSNLHKIGYQSGQTIEVTRVVRGGDKNLKSGMMYAILFFVSLSPLYFLNLGIMPLKSLLARNVITRAMNPIGRYLVCTLGMKTLFRRIQTLLSLFKYLIFIIAVFTTFALGLISLCVMVKGKTIFDSPENIRKPVKTGYEAATIFTVIFMLFYFSYRWFDYVAITLISIFKKNYYTNVALVPGLKAARIAFDKMKGIGLNTATFGGASDILAIATTLKGVASTMEKITKSVPQYGCEIEGYDSIAADLMRELASMKKNDGKLTEDEIKGRDRKSFCFDFNEYLDDNEFVAYCSSSQNSQCCTSSMFFKIASVLYAALTEAFGMGHQEDKISKAILRDVNKTNLATATSVITMLGDRLGMTAQLLIAAIAFFEQAKELDDAEKEAGTHDFYITDQTIKIQDTGSKPLPKSVQEDKIHEKMLELEKEGFHTLALYDDKYTNVKLGVKGILMVKRRVTFEDVDNRIDALKTILREKNLKYDEDDNVVNNVFKPYFISNVCDVLNGLRATRDVSEEIGGLEDAVDMVKSGMATGRWCSIGYMLAYIILLLMGLFGAF